MTKKVITLMTAGLLLAAASFALDAAPMRRDMMKHARFGIRMAEKNLFPAPILLKLKEKIGLSEAQVSKIEKMQQLFTESAIKQRADIKILEVKLNSVLKSDRINRKSLEKMIREIADMKTDMQINHMNYLLDLKELLTPEQLKKIEELKEQRRQQRLEKRGHRFKERLERRREM